MTMMNLARHIISVANENDLTITNLQLQKVMYFSIQNALTEGTLSREVIEDEYDEPFLVWRYGPVVQDVYEKYSKFGSSPIIENTTLDNRLSNMDDVIIDLLRENTFRLVQRSHEEEFWKNHENDIIGWRSNIPYELNNIQNNN
ncbi:Panacea domain-containing protein [Weissella sp. MSCH1]|uniref:Panacea domain-containing protein n=1 Tax=Weissella sp. MSCH1 TaxID=3383343 RepID=UPI003896D60F